jgi:tetratricopeptide (TPR) repeat protein
LKSLYSNDNWELQRKYLAQAIQAYKKSLEIDSNRYDTWFNLGLAYHISDNYLEAGRCYCQAIHMQPLSYEAHFNLAVLLRRMRHYKESYEEIEKAATLITALDGNSAAQQYVAIVMNDIMRTMYGSEEYRKQLKTFLNEEKSKTAEHIKTKAKAKETKEDKEKGTVTTESVNLVNGRVVVTEELDKAILKNFGKCPAMKLFTHDDDD